MSNFNYSYQNGNNRQKILFKIGIIKEKLKKNINSDNLKNIRSNFEKLNELRSKIPNYQRNINNNIFNSIKLSLNQSKKGTAHGINNNKTLENEQQYLLSKMVNANLTKNESNRLEEISTLLLNLKKSTGSVIASSLSKNTIQSQDRCEVPSGWKYVNVPGNGSCCFHSIAKYYEILGWDLFDKISNQYINLPQNIQNNSNKFFGLALREALIKFLLEMDGNSNILNVKTNYGGNIGIVEYKLNKNTFISELRIYKYNKNNNKASHSTTYMSTDIFFLLANFLQKNIFLLNKTDDNRCVWNLYKPKENVETPNKTNSIFLYLNVRHYQVLVPDDTIYIFRENNFNISRNTIIFNNNNNFKYRIIVNR